MPGFVDLNNQFRTVTCNSGAEERAPWRNMWTGVLGHPPDPGARLVDRIEFDNFPGQPGTYEKAVAALASMRAN